MRARVLKREGLSVLLACFVTASPAAADSPSARPGELTVGEPALPQVGGDDIFGVTTPTDLGSAGDRNFVNENDGRLGKRDGASGALNTKYEFSYTITDDWWVAVSPFLAFNRARNVTGFARIFPDKIMDRAVFAGPTFLGKIDKNVAVNVTFQPQVWGRSEANPGFGLDLDNFERARFRF